MNDPFASLEGPRTFLRPNPGGWAARPAAEPTGDTGAMEAPPVDHGFNPLLAVANRLLMLVPQLRQTRHVADPAALRASLAQG
ncbi:MAG TPA: type VI secretion system protein TssL, partial [Burkholderiaceae bacterium]|nr:type VI secretion system protein TssL [Burkholderiaceae bacterium]